MEGSLSSDSTSVFSSSTHSFQEKDFQLPDLEVNSLLNFTIERENRRQLKRINDLKSKVAYEKKLLKELDRLTLVPDEEFNHRKGVTDRLPELQLRREQRKSATEIKVIEHALSRNDENVEKEITALTAIMEGTYEGDEDDYVESTIDHPKLGSVEEKLEDLRQEMIENWCKKHGTVATQKYTNLEKRMLRRWFCALDYDGSGEVSTEELQDPMLSSGILKTREQVVRVMANVDQNNTNGIDFEEFLMALSANKFADQSKLKKLQMMSADPFFETDTLLTAERRNKLMKSILRRCEERQHAIDKLYKKYDKLSSHGHRMSKKDYESYDMELEQLEEQQSKSIYLHMKYIHALEMVIQERKQFYEEQAEYTKEQNAIPTSLDVPGIDTPLRPLAYPDSKPNSAAQLHGYQPVGIADFHHPENELGRLTSKQMVHWIKQIRKHTSNRMEALQALELTVTLPGIATSPEQILSSPVLLKNSANMTGVEDDWTLGSSTINSSPGGGDGAGGGGGGGGRTGSPGSLIRRLSNLGDVSTILSSETGLISHNHTKTMHHESGLYSAYTRPLLGKDRYLDALQPVMKHSIPDLLKHPYKIYSPVRAEPLAPVAGSGLKHRVKKSDRPPSPVNVRKYSTLASPPKKIFMPPLVSSPLTPTSSISSQQRKTSTNKR